MTILDIVVNILELTYVSMPIAKHGSLWFENNEKMLCGCQLNLTLNYFLKVKLSKGEISQFFLFYLINLFILYPNLSFPSFLSCYS